MLYYWKKKLGRLVRKLIGRPAFPSRYDHIYEEIRRIRPKRILEVGTQDGLNALRMVRAARDVGADPEYYGFDLFEMQTPDDFKREFSLRARSAAEVTRFLRMSGVRNFSLVAGDTTKTIPASAPDLPQMDLIFIDGGHSFETVLADWTNVQWLIGEETVVLFDDYPNFGIKPVIDGMDKDAWRVEILPNTDRFRASTEFEDDTATGFREFQIAKVTRRARTP